MSDTPRRDTRIQHLGEPREELGAGAAPPIYRTSLFTFPDSAALEAAFAGRSSRSIYTRVSNPTTRILERKLADLEQCEESLALASGMAAVAATLLGLLETGDHVVMLASAYAPTLAFATGPLARFGVDTTLLPAAEFERLEKHVTARTKLLYLESPASLTFEVLDLRALAAFARERGLRTVVDNSWATPIWQRPARFGIDLSLHSGTKYIGGHSDILLGVIAGSRELISRVHETAILLGGTLSPEDAFLAIRGLRTLPLRMQRHQDSGLRVARFLAGHPAVERVLHPGLESFPGHALAREQLDGWSGLFSFTVRGDARRLADALELFEIGVSWGGHESLVLPVVSTQPAGADNRLRADVPETLVRLSIGLEDPEDLIADLAQALEKSR